MEAVWILVMMASAASGQLFPNLPSTCASVSCLNTTPCREVMNAQGIVNGRCLSVSQIPASSGNNLGCKIGQPLLIENSGSPGLTTAFCGRGFNRVACPINWSCNISATDTYAFCCQTVVDIAPAPTPAPAPSCATMKCAANQKCVQTEVNCFRPPCPQPEPQCVDIVTVKLGDCSEPVQNGEMFGICANMCDNDDSCEGNKKCCRSNPCGAMQCETPINLITCANTLCAPGHSCRDVLNKSTGIKTPECYPITCEAKKCGANQKCVQAVFNCIMAPCPQPEPQCVDTGKCPAPAGAGICISECINDDQCNGVQKCCSNGCGQLCMDPVTVIDPCTTADCRPGYTCKSVTDPLTGGLKAECQMACKHSNGTIRKDLRLGGQYQPDPCTFCNCDKTDGMIFCAVMDCARPVCDNPVRVDGQCCGVCPQGCRRPDGTVEEGKNPGDRWKQDSCTSCTCDRDNNVACVSTACAIPACDNPVQEKDQCCPVCPKAECPAPVYSWKQCRMRRCETNSDCSGTEICCSDMPCGKRCKVPTVTCADKKCDANSRCEMKATGPFSFWAEKKATCVSIIPECNPRCERNYKCEMKATPTPFFAYWFQPPAEETPTCVPIPVCQPTCERNYKCEMRTTPTYWFQPPAEDTPTCVPVPTCELPSEAGMCKGYFPRYFYNAETKKCEKFVYGGCGGNSNNFYDLDSCKNTCSTGAGPIAIG